ncbi:hypothetical protein PENSTE_c005G04042 [Penicillium steckii]|uniref:Uncharacterized protein n=1 Tax=Penicillium steckii TaxID=303698 RepID=A0A1V6TK97_9EURO|nr:hypothetical protein PENSTE_c005G04042 [Penicillium steckii]
MLNWLKRLFAKDSNPGLPESKYESLKEEEQTRSSNNKGRRQRARERQLTRDHNKEDRRWSVKRGGAAFVGVA